MVVHPTATASYGSSLTSRYTLTITDVPDLTAPDLTAVDLTVPDDGLDEYCDHLTVRGVDGSVVGACRLMTPAGAAAAGRRCADDTFNLAGLQPLRDRLVDIDRVRVHPGHRSGAVVIMMWTAVARYLHLNDLRWIGGRATLPAGDGGRAAVDAWRQLRPGQLVPPTLRVRPRQPCPGITPTVGAMGVGAMGVGAMDGLPARLRGPLRLGAWVGGEPSYDAERRTAEFFILLSLDRLIPRYRRHFLGATR